MSQENHDTEKNKETSYPQMTAAKQGRFTRIFKNLRLRKKVNTKEKIETPEPIKEKTHKKKFSSFLSFFKRRSNKVGVCNGEPVVSHLARIQAKQRRCNFMRGGGYERLRERLRWRLFCFKIQGQTEEVEDEKHIFMQEEVPASVAFEVNIDEEPNASGRTSRCLTPMPSMVSNRSRRGRPSLDDIDDKMARAREKRLQKQIASGRPRTARRTRVVKKKIDLKLMEELRAKEQQEHINVKMKRAEESRQRQFAERIRPESARRERVASNRKNMAAMQEKELQMNREKLNEKFTRADENKNEIAAQRKEHVEKVKDHAEDVIIAKLENDRNDRIKRSKQLVELKQNLAAKEIRKQTRVDEKMMKLRDKHAIVDERRKAKARERSLPPLRLPNKQISQKFMIQLIEGRLIKEREEIKSRSGFRAEDGPSTEIRYSLVSPDQTTPGDTTRDGDGDVTKEDSNGYEPWPKSF